MKSLLKHFFYAVAPTIFGGLSRRASILAYHSISNRRTHLAVSPADFEKQVAYIATRYTPVFLSELVRRLCTGEDISGCVVVTLDDGYADSSTNAFPILARHHVPVSIFLITDTIGGTFTDSAGNAYNMLSEGQMRDMRATGLVEFLPHTKSHTVMPVLDSARLDEEIEGARVIVGRILGEDVPRIFAYPKGRVSDAARIYLKEHDWVAVATMRGLVRNDSDRLALPRNGVDPNISWTRFRALFSGAVDAARRLSSL